MSRIGNQPIAIDKDTKVSVLGNKVEVTGPKGQMTITLPVGIKCEVEENMIKISPSTKMNVSDLHGLSRSLVNNAVLGVTKGWSKTLELVGVGYRAQTTGQELVLNLGFSHDVRILAPEGITFSVVESKITVAGRDKYLVGEIAANIKRLKPPEPYKGKGIRYLGEIIRKKAGKSAKAVTGAK